MNGRELDWLYRAQNAVKAFGLWDLGWRVVLSNTKNALGQCNKQTKQIKLSRFYIKFQDRIGEETIKDTLLHEIAHALAWEKSGDFGHGPIWKMWARHVGADPKRLKEVDLPDEAYPWQLIDSRNGQLIRGWFRQPRKYPESRVKRMFLTNDPQSAGLLKLVYKGS